MPGFRRLNPPPAQRPRDSNLAPFKYQIIPLKRQGLSQSHPGACQGHKERIIARCFLGGGENEELPLLACHRLDLFLPYRFRGDQSQLPTEFFGRINRNDAIIHSCG